MSPNTKLCSAFFAVHKCVVDCVSPNSSKHHYALLTGFLNQKDYIITGKGYKSYLWARICSYICPAVFISVCVVRGEKCGSLVSFWLFLQRMNAPYCGALECVSMCKVDIQFKLWNAAVVGGWSHDVFSSRWGLFWMYSLWVIFT